MNESPVIKVSDLKKTFTVTQKKPGISGAVKTFFWPDKNFVEAVKGISFSIQPGEFVGFVGPNGAGKTTTLKMLTGILYPTEGHVRVLGYSPQKRETSFQKKFALVMGQKNQLWWDLPATESFLLNRAIYEIPKEDFERRLNELSDLFQVQHILHVQVRKLSLGERMKCELIAALLHEPKILFLDEPTIGLDVVSQRNIRRFLKEYNRQKKATIILTSHYMEDIRRLCPRVMIIDHGAMLYDGEYQKLTHQFAQNKSIEMTFSSSVKKEDLEKYAEVISFRGLSARLSVPREKVPEKTTALLHDLPIEDISIHEASMEDIVSDIFQGKKKV